MAETSEAMVEVFTLFLTTMRAEDGLNPDGGLMDKAERVSENQMEKKSLHVEHYILNKLQVILNLKTVAPLDPFETLLKLTLNETFNCF